ncbi:GNAT family N-acetyltransferase [Nocardia concava]|uniref:GNAT family N-acetyltransferase n=1 Tax=Nocardia concava TaxID=257281 RepID=UPI000300F609|nr:GNAT family N-acetyltransferase [Nocardia concava]
MPSLVDPICDLYDEAFSVPPFVWPADESTHHRRLLERLIADPTFGLSIAEVDGGLVGFAYGYRLGPNTNWWNGFQNPVPDDLSKERPGRTFAVIDLAVQQEWRRQGIGRGVLDLLLKSRSEERATLAVQPQAIASHNFYEAIGGWQYVGRQDTPGYVSPEFDIYVRVLNP